LEGKEIANLACLKCEYSLQGLVISMKCPECGTPIVESLPDRHLLRYTDMAWLGSIACGLTWLYRAVLVGVIAPLSFFVLILLLGVIDSFTGIFKTRVPDSFFAVLLVFPVSVTGALVFACWKLSKQGKSRMHVPWRARVLVRYASLIGLGTAWIGSVLPGDIQYPLTPYVLCTFLASSWLAMYGLNVLTDHLERRTTSREQGHGRSFLTLHLLSTAFLCSPLLMRDHRWEPQYVSALFFPSMYFATILQRVRDAFFAEYAVARAMQRPIVHAG
jgi:hypothetical protein